MLKIDFYENESKKLDGCNHCCASINTDDFDGYTSLEQISPRCENYDDAKEELLKHVIKLRDELNDFIEREGKTMLKNENIIKGTIIGSMKNQAELDFIYPNRSYITNEWQRSTVGDFTSLRKLAMSVVDKVDGRDNFKTQKVKDLSDEDLLLATQCADEIAKVVAKYKKQYLESIGRKDIIEAFKM